MYTSLRTKSEFQVFFCLKVNFQVIADILDESFVFLIVRDEKIQLKNVKVSRDFLSKFEPILSWFV